MTIMYVLLQKQKTVTYYIFCLQMLLLSEKFEYVITNNRN